MEQEQFAKLMPHIILDLVTMIAEKQNLSNAQARRKLYNSNLYKLLEKEETKLWYYSTHMLYSLFEQEEKLGIIRFPDV